MEVIETALANEDVVDKWISDFSVKTGRLLGSGEKNPYAVRMSANVRIKVLLVNDQNLCLVGD